MIDINKYIEIHRKYPDKIIKILNPLNKDSNVLTLLGKVVEIKYKVISPSIKRHDVIYCHTFDDPPALLVGSSNNHDFLLIMGNKIVVNNRGIIG